MFLAYTSVEQDYLASQTTAVLKVQLSLNAENHPSWTVNPCYHPVEKGDREDQGTLTWVSSHSIACYI